MREPTGTLDSLPIPGTSFALPRPVDGIVIGLFVSLLLWSGLIFGASLMVGSRSSAGFGIEHVRAGEHYALLRFEQGAMPLE